MKRSKPLRRRTPKRAAKDRQAQKWRDAQVRIVGQCERCKCRELSRLCVHEIFRGTGGRPLAYDKGYASLVLCNPKCHDEVGGWCQTKALALLYLRRPGEYDLAAFNLLVNPRAPKRITQDEVDAYIEELTRAA